MFETVVVVSLFVSAFGLWFTLLPLWTLHPLECVFQRRMFLLAAAIVGTGSDGVGVFCAGLGHASRFRRGDADSAQ